MPKIQKQTPKIAEDEIRRLVIERLRTMSPNKGISIGSSKAYTKEQLIKEVENSTKIGKKIVEIEVEFLQSLKDLPIYAP